MLTSSLPKHHLNDSQGASEHDKTVTSSSRLADVDHTTSSSLLSRFKTLKSTIGTNQTSDQACMAGINRGLPPEQQIKQIHQLLNRPTQQAEHKNKNSSQCFDVINVAVTQLQQSGNKGSNQLIGSGVLHATHQRRANDVDIALQFPEGQMPSKSVIDWIADSIRQLLTKSSTSQTPSRVTISRFEGSTVINTDAVDIRLTDAPIKSEFAHTKRSISINDFFNPKIKHPKTTVHYLCEREEIPRVNLAIENQLIDIDNPNGTMIGKIFDLLAQGYQFKDDGIALKVYTDLFQRLADATEITITHRGFQNKSKYLYDKIASKSPIEMLHGIIHMANHLESIKQEKPALDPSIIDGFMATLCQWFCSNCKTGPLTPLEETLNGIESLDEKLTVIRGFPQACADQPTTWHRHFDQPNPHTLGLSLGSCTLYVDQRNLNKPIINSIQYGNQATTLSQFDKQRQNELTILSYKPSENYGSPHCAEGVVKLKTVIHREKYTIEAPYRLNRSGTLDIDLQHCTVLHNLLGWEGETALTSSSTGFLSIYPKERITFHPLNSTSDTLSFQGNIEDRFGERTLTIDEFKLPNTLIQDDLSPQIDTLCLDSFSSADEILYPLEISLQGEKTDVVKAAADLTISKHGEQQVTLSAELLSDDQQKPRVLIDKANNKQTITIAKNQLQLILAKKPAETRYQTILSYRNATLDTVSNPLPSEFDRLTQGLGPFQTALTLSENQAFLTWFESTLIQAKSESRQKPTIRTATIQDLLSASDNGAKKKRFIPSPTSPLSAGSSPTASSQDNNPMSTTFGSVPSLTESGGITESTSLSESTSIEDSLDSFSDSQSRTSQRKRVGALKRIKSTVIPSSYDLDLSTIQI